MCCDQKRTLITKRLSSPVQFIRKSCEPHQKWPWSDNPCKRVPVNYFGPFWVQMCLVIVDARSKWIEVFPTKGWCSLTTTILTLRSLFVSFGLPEMIFSDNDTACLNAKFKEFVEKNAMSHLISAPYYAASNSLFTLSASGKAK